MNTKDTKKYSLIHQILNSQPRNMELTAWLAELAGIDFTVAFEVWEYILAAYQKDLADKSIAENVGTKAFDMFINLSETKTRQLLLASDPLIKLVYGACATSCTGANLAMLTQYILATKIEAAESMLSAVRSNPTGDFGERMRIIVDSVFKTYCESKGVKKCELNRKQSTLLLDYCAKIKGPNKMLLTQRIKEL